MRNREEAEDLTSEIFLKAVQGVDYRRSPREVQNWLYRIAHTTLADHWHHRYRHHTFSLEQYLREEDSGPVDQEDEESCYSCDGRDRYRKVLQITSKLLATIYNKLYLNKLSKRAYPGLVEIVSLELTREMAKRCDVGNIPASTLKYLHEGDYLHRDRAAFTKESY